MAEDWWKDVTVRARKVEGGYESIFDLDGEELVVNVMSFETIAEVLEKKLGRKPTPEEVDEKSREWAENPMFAFESLPPVPRPGEEGLGEIASNWGRVRTLLLGKPELERRMAVMKKEREK